MKRTCIVAAAALALSGCAAAASYAPPSSAAANPASSGGIPHAASARIGGRYGGTMTDKSLGKGTATMLLSQNGAEIGGYVSTVFSSGKVIQAVALQVASNDTLTGDSVASVDGNACTFALTATYAAASGTSPTLNGKYSAIHGCTGDRGTFKAVQGCFFHGDAARPDGGLPRPC